MPIEFRCPSCQKLLRTPDDSGGKQAKCPQCGAINTVPAAAGAAAPAPGTPPPEAAPPPSDWPPASNSSPFEPRGFGPDTGNPYQAPGRAAGAPLTLGPKPDIVPTQMDLGDVLSRGWTIFQSQMGMAILIIFVGGIINSGLQFAMNMAVNLAAVITKEQAVAVAVPVILVPVQWAIQLWVMLGQFIVLLKIARGEEGVFTDMFAGARFLISGLVANFLFALLLIVIAAVCVGPAGLIYLATEDEQATLIAALIGGPIGLLVAIPVALMFSQSSLLVVDRDVGPLDALQLSMTITSGNKLTLFLLMLVFFALNLAGCAAFCIGMLFTQAYAMLTMCVAYLAMTGQPTGDRFLQPPPRAAAPPPGPPLA